MSTLCRAKWNGRGNVCQWNKTERVCGSHSLDNHSSDEFFRPVHPSAFASFCLEGRVKGGRNISDNPKNFGNISEKRPFSEIISDYFFGERDRPGRCAARLAPHFRVKP